MSNMDRPPTEEERFFNNVMGLTDLMHELSSMCWDAGVKDINPQLISLARGYLSGYNKTELIDTFIKYSWEYWGEISERNQDFFIEHANSIFEHLPVKTENINAFKVFMRAKDEYGEYVICQEDREAIWDYFEAMVKISIKYIHRVRGVKLIEKENGFKPVYIKSKFPSIKVRKLAKEWNIELPMPSLTQV